MLENDINIFFFLDGELESARSEESNGDKRNPHQYYKNQLTGIVSHLF